MQPKISIYVVLCVFEVVEDEKKIGKLFSSLNMIMDSCVQQPEFFFYQSLRLIFTLILSLKFNNIFKILKLTYEGHRYRVVFQMYSILLHSLYNCQHCLCDFSFWSSPETFHESTMNINLVEQKERLVRIHPLE